MVERAPGFDDFWREYPSKVGRKPCEAKWQSLGCDQHAVAILADVAKRKTDDDRWRDGFIPNPLTYLNQERWKDEIVRRAKRRNDCPPANASFAGKDYSVGATPDDELFSQFNTH